MKKRPFLLTDLQDRALASCDDMYFEVPSAREVLQIWYERAIPFTEFRCDLQRLVDLGLLGAYEKRQSRYHRVPLQNRPMSQLFIRATGSGCTYLKLKRVVAAPGAPAGR
jgi:hypothetical protein